MATSLSRRLDRRQLARHTERAVIGGTIDNVSISLTVGVKDATCTGLVGPRTTRPRPEIIPPVDEGERVR